MDSTEITNALNKIINPENNKIGNQKLKAKNVNKVFFDNSDSDDSDQELVKDNSSPEN